MSSADSRQPEPPPIDWQVELAKHRGWLQTVVLARLGESAALSEVMQEIALAAAKNEEQLRDRDKLPAWLYRIAVVTALQYRRRVGRERNLRRRIEETAPTDSYAEADARQPDPLDWLIAKEQQAMVREALEGLPGKDAEILLLKYTQNWSYAQLSQRLSISESAVDGRLQRARKRLRKQLAARDTSLV